MKFLSHIVVALGLIHSSILYAAIPVEREFQVIEHARHTASAEKAFYLRTIRGIECTNNSLNRLSMRSENQKSYPTPESGCGPTTMLNILIWYEKYGLIQPSNREADPARYKSKLFQKIDQRLTQQSGVRRTATTGVNHIDTAIVMDSIIRERSGDTMRIHTDTIIAPLKLSDFLETMPHFRSGYVIVTYEDPNTGQLLNNHAATVIRADRAGYITLATWGQVYRGRLSTRGDGQWFIPQDPIHFELKVRGLTRFIPFRPSDSQPILNQ